MPTGKAKKRWTLSGCLLRSLYRTVTCPIFVLLQLCKCKCEKKEKPKPEDDENFKIITKTDPSVTYDCANIYWDQDGNLRYGASPKDRETEILEILKLDSADESDPNKLWIIIPSKWIRLWLTFAVAKNGKAPSKINTSSLLINTPSGLRPKKNLSPPGKDKDGKIKPGHYRRISKEAWDHLADVYKVDSAVIAVYGTPFDDISRWCVFADSSKINIEAMPQPIIPAKPEEKKTPQDLLAKQLKESAALIPKDLSGAKKMLGMGLV